MAAWEAASGAVVRVARADVGADVGVVGVGVSVGGSVTTTWQLVPPMPKELTPATRRTVLAWPGRLALLHFQAKVG